MAETTSLDHHEVESNQGISIESEDVVKDHSNLQMGTPNAAANKLNKMAEEIYESPGYSDNIVGKPTKGEVWLWYLYEFCSYFIHNTLVPVLFPLIISQVLKLPPEPARGWEESPKGLSCKRKESMLYEALTYKSININDTKFSPLMWTSFSWGLGLILAGPVVASISTHLDYGNKQLLMTISAIAIGAFFCLPTGFFNVTWIFPPYIAAIIITSIIASSSHTRQFSLMVKSFTNTIIQKNQFRNRRGISSFLSLYSTAVGGIGSAVISTFIYHMLKHSEKFISLWVVSIFSGLMWLIGISHAFYIKPGSLDNNSPISNHLFTILKYPQALGTLILAFVSSFTTMCIFTSSVLYLIGDLCLKPLYILIIWLTYFLFPIFSLSLLHPLQQFIKANAVKMHLLGFYLLIATSTVGFYYRGKIWHRGHVIVLTTIQSTSVGLLHAFGRVLMVDCTPHEKEGVFSAWFSWWRAAGSCVGFAVASSIPGKVSTCFGIAFGAAIFGTLLLNFGNISDFKGAVAAGLVYEEANDEGASSVEEGLDTSNVKQEKQPDESLA